MTSVFQLYFNKHLKYMFYTDYIYLENIIQKCVCVCVKTTMSSLFRNKLDV